MDDECPKCRAWAARFETLNSQATRWSQQASRVLTSEIERNKELYARVKELEAQLAEQAVRPQGMVALEQLAELVEKLDALRGPTLANSRLAFLASAATMDAGTATAVARVLWVPVKFNAELKDEAGALLLELLRHKDPGVRAEAADSLARIRDDAYLGSLYAALGREECGYVKTSMDRAIKLLEG